MDKTEILKDGATVKLRPLTPEDAYRFYWFLGGLSEEDRTYLKVDVTDRDLVLERVRIVDSDRIVRIVAEVGREIVAEGELLTAKDGWAKDIGEIRLLVAPAYRRKGLGLILGREIYILAVEKRLRKIVARMMRPQKAAQRIFHKLGFREEAVLPDLVTDQSGKPQDLLVMTVNLQRMRQELRSFFESSDWRMHR